MPFCSLLHTLIVISALVLGSVYLSEAAATTQELKDACEKGDVTTCESLGSLYWLGEGEKQDVGQAMVFYGKACDGGQSRACFILGVLHAKGTSGKQGENKGEWSITLTVVEQISHIAAVIVGGVWVYYNFFRGRTYKPRMEPSVSAELNWIENNRLVLVTFELKNVGLSRIPIEQRGTALIVLGLFEKSFRIQQSDIHWQDLHTLSVFTDHGWIEPNEIIREQRLIPLDDHNLIALKLELRIVSKGHEWNAQSIINRGIGSKGKPAQEVSNE